MRAVSQLGGKQRSGGVSALAYREGSGSPPERNKVVLVAIEMFPLCWLFAIDRFYLGNIGLAIAKLAVSVGTLFVGGLIWGIVDFIIIVSNALRREETLQIAGMSAKFSASHLHMAYILAIVDILMIPAAIGLSRFIWLWRKWRRAELLREAAMRSRHYRRDPCDVK